MCLCWMVYPKIYLLKPIKNAKPFPSHNHIPSSPAPYLCPPPACAGGWSSAVSPPGGSECVPQCSLLGGEGQAQLKTQKAPGTGSPDRMQEDEEEEEEAERWSRTKQDTHQWKMERGDGEAMTLHNTTTKCRPGDGKCAKILHPSKCNRKDDMCSISSNLAQLRTDSFHKTRSQDSQLVLINYIGWKIPQTTNKCNIH